MITHKPSDINPTYSGYSTIADTQSASVNRPSQNFTAPDYFDSNLFPVEIGSTNTSTDWDYVTYQNKSEDTGISTFRSIDMQNVQIQVQQKLTFTKNDTPLQDVLDTFSAILRHLDDAEMVYDPVYGIVYAGWRNANKQEWTDKKRFFAIDSDLPCVTGREQDLANKRYSHLIIDEAWTVGTPKWMLPFSSSIEETLASCIQLGLEYSNVYGHIVANAHGIAYAYVGIVNSETEEADS